MKQLYYSAIFYTVLGLLSGIFAREMTRHFDGETQLAFLHTHLFALGTTLFLVFMALEKVFALSKAKKFQLFFWHYNGGVLLTTLMMAIHGVMDVQGVAFSPMLSGIAGIGHILVGAGFLFFFMSLHERLIVEKYM